MSLIILCTFVRMSVSKIKAETVIINIAGRVGPFNDNNRC